MKNKTESKVYYTEDHVVSMLEFLIDNIFVKFGGRIFQQIIDIPMGTNCAPTPSPFVFKLIRVGVPSKFNKGQEN